eukprot:scaffold1442_cov128-Cylindrotheca_fusiformis.AAC.18
MSRLQFSRQKADSFGALHTGLLRYDENFTFHMELKSGVTKALGSANAHSERHGKSCHRYFFTEALKTGLRVNSLTVRSEHSPFDFSSCNSWHKVRLHITMLTRWQKHEV